jgi:transposase
MLGGSRSNFVGGSPGQRKKPAGGTGGLSDDGQGLLRLFCVFHDAADDDEVFDDDTEADSAIQYGTSLVTATAQADLEVEFDRIFTDKTGFVTLNRLLARLHANKAEHRPGQKPRNNRRILSGIIHVLKIGCRWQDCPPEYRPYTTVYNRFNRWSERGIWQQIFETVAGSPEPPEQVALDSTHVKTHRCAGGGKGGLANRRSGSPGVAVTAKFMRLSISYTDRG